MWRVFVERIPHYSATTNGHSTFEQPLPKGWARSAATAHPSKNHPVEGKWHVYPEMAAAGLWTTPSDLARAGIEVQLVLKGETNGVLSVGEYTNKAGLKFSVANEKGTLFLSAAGQPPLELHPVSDTKFFISILNTELTFDRADKGKARALNLMQEGTQISAERKR